MRDLSAGETKGKQTEVRSMVNGISSSQSQGPHDSASNNQDEVSKSKKWTNFQIPDILC